MLATPIENVLQFPTRLCPFNIYIFSTISIFQCSVSCGEGMQQREVWCEGSNHCDTRHTLSSEQTCNVIPCPTVSAVTESKSTDSESQSSVLVAVSTESSVQKVASKEQTYGVDGMINESDSVTGKVDTKEHDGVNTVDNDDNDDDDDNTQEKNVLNGYDSNNNDESKLPTAGSETAKERDFPAESNMENSGLKEENVPKEQDANVNIDAEIKERLEALVKKSEYPSEVSEESVEKSNDNDFKEDINVERPDSVKESDEEHTTKDEEVKVYKNVDVIAADSDNKETKKQTADTPLGLPRSKNPYFKLPKLPNDGKLPPMPKLEDLGPMPDMKDLPLDLPKVDGKDKLPPFTNPDKLPDISDLPPLPDNGLQVPNLQNKDKLPNLASFKTVPKIKDRNANLGKLEQESTVSESEETKDAAEDSDIVESDKDIPNNDIESDEATGKISAENLPQNVDLNTDKQSTNKGPVLNLSQMTLMKKGVLPVLNSDNRDSTGEKKNTYQWKPSTWTEVSVGVSCMQY